MPKVCEITKQRRAFQERLRARIARKKITRSG